METNKNKKIIGITCSCFDLLHAGHIKMLEDAKSQCDSLVAALQVDPTLDRPDKNKPIQTIVERYIQLNGCKHVDEVVPYHTEKDLEDLLMFLPITMRICGEEYKERHLTGRDICDARGIRTHYNSRTHRFSSSELRQRTYQSELSKVTK